MRALIPVCLLAALAAPSAVRAAPPPRPVVLELFTSEGCSSCPPADAILSDIARSRADVLPLAFHITYWDNLGWKDPFSFAAATQRQRGYVGISQAGTIYTPQAVVDGTIDVVGSDQSGVTQALARAAARAQATAPVDVSRIGDTVSIAIGAGSGAGTVWLIGYDSEHTTRVGRGENAGETLRESNIVRSLQAVGAWQGEKLEVTRGVPAGEKLAVIVQSADGKILGAARLQPGA
jgi:hypothetical protein